jgi:hypothetical protein
MAYKVQSSGKLRKSSADFETKAIVFKRTNRWSDKKGKTWLIPSDVVNPEDARYRNKHEEDK